MDYNRNMKYFDADKATLSRNVKIILIIAGVLLLAAYGIGLLLIGVVILFHFLDKSANNKRISDSELDHLCESQFSDLRAEALNRIGLDEDEVSAANHIQVSSYDTTSKGMGIKYRQGKDGVWRSSQYEVALFFFSNDLVHCFVRRFSIIRNEQKDTVEEYFYRDIVSLKVDQNDKDAHGGEFIELTTSAGTTFRYSFKKADSEKVNRSINAMRNLIKEKKQAMN